MREQFLTFIFLLSILIVPAQNEELDSLMLQLAFQKPDTSKVNTSIKLIENFYNNKNYKKAIMFIDESESLARTLNYDKGIAQTIYFKALIFATKDDYYNAIDNFNKCKTIFERTNNTLELANVNNGIGIIEINRGNYKSGLESSLKAISVFEERYMFDKLSTAYDNLATAYFNTDKIDKSLEYNFKALDVREHLKDTTSLTITYRNIASIYSLKMDHDNSILYFEKVLSLLEGNNDISIRGEILPKLGQEYLAAKDYKKAAENLIAGAKFNRQNKNKVGLLLSLNGLAELNLANRRFDYAEGQLTEASIIAQELNSEKELLNNHRLMMKLDSSKGNFENAFMWQREYHLLKDKLYKKENTNKSNLIETAYIPNEKDQQLFKEQQLKEEENLKEIDKLKLITYILIGAFTLTATFLLLIYLKRKSRIKYTKELEEKNKQIQKQNREILSQSKNLEEINVVKDKLFSIVSHDLKDSVNSIKGLIDLLKDGSLSDDEFNTLVPELSENADNASLLLFNLLNWSKSQMESLEPKPEYFNLQEIFRDKLKLVSKKIKNKKIILVDETNPDTIYADRSMIEIVIQNLLTNAVKFCHSGDVISISNSSSNRKALFYIKDTGVGISKENQEKLFKSNSFTTVGTTNEKGTGLGLSICKDLVELNHGKIWVESSVNIGSKFYVELPKERSY